MKEIFMFLRFYNQPKQSVESYLTGLLQRNPEVRRFSIQPIDRSVNMAGFDPNQSWEGRIYFKNNADLKKCYANKAEIRLYEKVSLGSIKREAKTVFQKPGDPVFGR